MSTYPESTATVIRTTSDVNFEKAQQIYAVAARITDAVQILEDLCYIIGDRTSSRNKLLEKASFVKKYVIPLFSDTISTITAAAKNFSPISASKYVHQRNEAKRKWDVELSNNTTLNPGEEMIVRHVKAIFHNNKMVDATPAAKQQCCSTACVSPTDTCDIITLPTPASGKAFNKIEVLNLMSKVTDCHIRAATAKAIIKHQKQYHVSLSKASIYRLLANHANGTVISGEFTGKGRPPICSDTDMKLIAKSLEEEVGKAYSKSDVKMTIKKIETEKLERARRAYLMQQ